MACMTILARSNKFASKWPRFSPRTNWKRFQRSWRWILGEKQLRGYRKKFWSILEIQGQCGSVATRWQNALPIASFYLWHIVYSHHVFVLSNPTWRRAHVWAGWLCKDPNVNVTVLQRSRWGSNLHIWWM